MNKQKNESLLSPVSHEAPRCTELRDLNLAILASTSPLAFEMHQFGAIDKLTLNDDLAQKIEDLFPLYARAICRLGSTQTKLGQQMGRESAVLQSKLGTDEKGTYYFSEDIFRQIDEITAARDRAEGKYGPNRPRSSGAQ